MTGDVMNQPYPADGDVRSIPTYTVGEVAQYLGLPKGTIRSWVVGRPYRTKRGKGFFEPLVGLQALRPPRLSFINLVEIHVLAAIRRYHEVPMDKVRKALDYVEDRFGLSHPLARQVFYTDGVSLFVDAYGSLTNVSQDGQLALRELLLRHLQRVDTDEQGLALRLYPFTRKPTEEDPRWIVIDPSVSFGQPVLAATGIPTAVLADRYKAGDSIHDLSADYSCPEEQVEEAIRCELPLAA